VNYLIDLKINWKRLLEWVAVCMILIGIALMLRASGTGEALNLVCAGTLTKTVAAEQRSIKSDVSNVTVVVNSRSQKVSSSLFAVKLPITGFSEDIVVFGTTWEAQSSGSRALRFGTQGIKFRIEGSVRPNGHAIVNELFTENGHIGKIWFWMLDCRQAKYRWRVATALI
jgi:hypothetical protein